jgi:hypothetical protein
VDAGRVGLLKDQKAAQHARCSGRKGTAERTAGCMWLHTQAAVQSQMSCDVMLCCLQVALVVSQHSKTC